MADSGSHPGNTQNEIHVNVAIACQGGASHAAFTAGVLDRLLELNDKPIQNGRAVRFRIVGLSGTSGGAICAALAWKQLLLRHDGRGLKEFWSNGYPDGNAALGWLDATAESASDFARDMSVPWLRWLDRLRVDLGTAALSEPAFWETVPFHLTPELRPYCWKNFFETCDDFVPLPTKWFLEAVQDVTARASEGRFGIPVAFAAQAFRQWLLLCPLLPNSPIRRECDVQDLMRALLARFFTEHDRRRMKESLVTAARHGSPLPELFIAATNVQRTHPDSVGPPDPSSVVNDDFIEQDDYHKANATNFEVFRGSEKLDTLVDYLLASVALPTLMRAVEIGGCGHWDALFSQNPALSPFLDLHRAGRRTAAFKAEEIWVIRIDPMISKNEPRTFREIEDRRNALAGNLSLLHEIRTIRELNAVEREADPDYTPISFGFIDIPDALASKLGYATKFDRRKEFLECLYNHGRTQADDFIARWRVAEIEWDEGRARQKAHRQHPVTSRPAREAAHSREHAHGH